MGQTRSFGFSMLVTFLHHPLSEAQRRLQSVEIPHVMEARMVLFVKSLEVFLVVTSQHYLLGLLFGQPCTVTWLALMCLQCKEDPWFIQQGLPGRFL